MMLKGILENEINEAWIKAEVPIIEACIRSRGKYSSQDVKDMLDNRHAQLWTWESDETYAVLVTKIVKYPRIKCCSIWIATGNNFEEWYLSSLKTIENYAKTIDCGAMELIARPGWGKFLAGYDKTHIYLEKYL